VNEQNVEINAMTIKTPPELKAMTHELTVSVWSYAALGALFESGLAGHMREPHTVSELAAKSALPAPRIESWLAVAASLGAVVSEDGRHRLAEGVLPFSQPPMGTSLRGEIRGTLLQALALLDAPATTGWRHTDRALLQAQGDASMGLVPMLKMHMIPTLGDLQSRLDSADARFLDVGVGVASLAIGMCRAFPSLRVVGVDSYDVPLAIARENVERAGLGERIELVRGAIEALDQKGAFDLAWLPTFFIADGALEAATERIFGALKPGGWVLYPTGSNPAASTHHRAVFGVVTDLWGGALLLVERATSLLQTAGFTSVRTVQGPPWAPAMLVGQRPAS
jgi:hypothetical protein